MASAVSFSGNVLHDLFGRGIKDFRVLENAAYIFESDGIRVPVGNAFVAGDAVIHITAFVDLAFAVELVFRVFHAEGKEYRNVAEVVKMVVYRRYAERTHRSDGKAAVEGRKLCELAWKQSEIIQQINETYVGVKEYSPPLARTIS